MMSKFSESGVEELNETDDRTAETTSAQNLISAAAASGTRPPTAAIDVDLSRAVAGYANFCRVTGTPEESIIDFGLNSQPMGVTTDPIAVTQRLVVNFYTAKRLLAALQMSIQRHEAAFGVVETDVHRRVFPNARRAEVMNNVRR